MAVGAEAQSGGGVHFRVWAPKARKLAARSGASTFPLESENNGYFSGFRADLRPGAKYAFQVDDSERLLPDPASRSQPDGPHGLSEVVDPSTFAWTDQNWNGPRLSSQVIYEMHVGTFTPEGAWRGASQKLPLLAETGVTLIEMMPVAAFSGTRNWGYDGVCWFAPTHLYGEPDDLRRFIDRAHALGIGVILDVVYNHFGPEGDYLPCFSDSYTTDKYPNEWGRALNFDGPDCAPVREYVRENACYWIREFHFDGLRLDATQQIFDDSDEHIVAELTRCAREAAPGRDIVIVAENEPQDSKLIRPPSKGGYGLDAIWNDDFHHASHVALTGHAEAYYSDYKGSSRELAAALQYGFLYQGQRSTWQSRRRGRPSLDVHAHQRINFLENHDQIANSGAGQRLVELADPGSLRAATALLLLAPGTPMLFQGQEFGSRRPFLFFADLGKSFDEPVAEGRRQFLSQFPSLRSVDLAAPHEAETFERCVLDWSDRERNVQVVQLHRDLISLRRTDRVLREAGNGRLDTATLSDQAFLVRFYGPAGEDRLLVVNFGKDLSPGIFPEPLLAPPDDRAWRLAWSSEDPSYGGGGIRAPESEDGEWHFAGHAAVFLRAEPSAEEAGGR
jgi:maltooligosyltrehalose trehalohydrolase